MQVHITAWAGYLFTGFIECLCYSMLMGDVTCARFSGGALAVDVAFLIYCAVLVFFIFWKKLYKETWYGMYLVL